jgi:putative phage-type endonuclease
MGISPFKTYEDLMNEKNHGFEQHVNQYMQRGIDLEPIALKAFESETGLLMFPCVGEHENGWMAASFDGMTLEEDVILEIKCAGKKDHQLALDGIIPTKYVPQLQHQLYVCGLSVVFYYSFDGQTGKIIEVKRDDAYIEIMIEKEKQFWESLKKSKINYRDLK